MTVKKSITYLIILSSFVLLVFYITLQKKETVEYTTAIVVKDSIKQTVNETGTVKSDLGIDLSFPGSGKLNEVKFNVGDKVLVGDMLAKLDYSNFEIRRNEALANLDVAKEGLNKLLSGASTEDILLSKASVDQAFKQYESAKKELDKTKQSVAESNRQAEISLSDLESGDTESVTSAEYAVEIAKTNLENAKKTYQKFIDNYSTTAISSCDDKISATNNVLDAINVIIENEDGEGLIGIKNKEQYRNTISDYEKSQELYVITKNSLEKTNLNPSNQNIQALVTQTLALLSKTFDTLHNCHVSLENSVTSSSFTLANLELLKAEVNGQQTIISTAIQLIQSIEQSLSSAILNYNTNISTAQNNLTNTETSYRNLIITTKNQLSSTKISGEKQVVLAESKTNNAFQSWQVAQARFKQLTANANKYDVNLAQARIRQAEASLNLARKQVEDSLIISPIDGVVTRVNFEIGEQVSPNIPVISLITQKKFEIVVMITETDISKIEINNDVQITLDSYGDEIKFYGNVLFVDPAETIIDGVIYYKTEINFNIDERAIKSGMTANVSIVTNLTENVLIVPVRALVNKDKDGVFARILKGDIVEEKKIEVGIYGDDGLVEVLSGLTEGEEVVTYIK